MVPLPILNQVSKTVSHILPCFILSSSLSTDKDMDMGIDTVIDKLSIEKKMHKIRVVSFGQGTY